MASFPWTRVLMGLWFLVTGAFVILSLRFAGQETIMAVFAIVIGILLLLGK